MTTQHASSKEAVGAAFVLSNAGSALGGGWAVLTKGTIKSSSKGTKGDKKMQKHRPCHFAVMASDGAKVDNCGEGFVATAEHDFKRLARPLKDHFEKLVEVACLHHPYPVKHKLKDYMMMKSS
jgi:hypothetical protein